MRRKALLVLAMAVVPLWLGACTPNNRESKEDCLSKPTSACLLLVARDLAKRDRSPIGSAGLLAEIAVAQAKAGDVKEARASLALAENAARQTDTKDPTHGSEFRDQAWAEVVAAWAKIGDHGRAMQLLDTAPGPGAREDAATALAKVYVAGGAFDDALNVARMAKYSTSRNYIYSLVAEAQIKAQDPAAGDTIAMIAQSAARISDPESRASALVVLGKLQIKVGQIDEASLTASKIAGYTNGDWLLRQIAAAQARNGEFDAAEKTMRRTKEKVSLVLGLSQVAAIAAKAGNRRPMKAFFRRALALSNAIPHGNERDQAFGRIAWYRAEAGHFREAMKMTANIAQRTTHDWMLNIVVGEMTKVGDFAAALSVAPRIKGLPWRADTYSDIGDAQAIAGQKDAARRSFEIALETHTSQRFRSVVARKQAKAGDLDGALKTTASITKEFHRAFALGDIAAEKARAGDIAEALRLAGQIKFKWHAADAYLRIARAQFKTR